MGEGGVQEVEMRRDPLLIVGRAELDVVEGGAGRQQLDPAGRLLGMVRIEAHGASVVIATKRNQMFRLVGLFVTKPRTKKFSF